MPLALPAAAVGPGRLDASIVLLRDHMEKVATWADSISLPVYREKDDPTRWVCRIGDEDLPGRRELAGALFPHNPFVGEHIYWHLSDVAHPTAFGLLGVMHVVGPAPTDPGRVQILQRANDAPEAAISAHPVLLACMAATQRAIIYYGWDDAEFAAEAARINRAMLDLKARS